MLAVLVTSQDHVDFLVLIQIPDHFRKLFGRVLQIIVHGDHKVALHIVETAEQGIMLAEIPGHLEYMHPLVLFAELLHDFEGAVF